MAEQVFIARARTGEILGFHSSSEYLAGFWGPNAAISSARVLTEEEWAKWRALYVAVYQQDTDAMSSMLKAINRSAYNATIAGDIDADL